VEQQEASRSSLALARLLRCCFPQPGSERLLRRLASRQSPCASGLRRGVAEGAGAGSVRSPGRRGGGRERHGHLAGGRGHLGGHGVSVGGLRPSPGCCPAGQRGRRAAGRAGGGRCGVSGVTERSARGAGAQAGAVLRDCKGAAVLMAAPESSGLPGGVCAAHGLSPGVFFHSGPQTLWVGAGGPGRPLAFLLRHRHGLFARAVAETWAVGPGQRGKAQRCRPFGAGPASLLPRGWLGVLPAAQALGWVWGKSSARGVGLKAWPSAGAPSH